MKRDEISKKFLKHNFHDFVLLGIQFLPATKRRNPSTVEVRLKDYDNNRDIVVMFTQVGNISFTGDCDVLVDNAGAGNTSHTRTLLDSGRLIKRINAQRRKWNVTYEEGVRNPIESKTLKINEFIAFTFHFHGGTLEVIAKNYRKRTANQAL